MFGRNKFNVPITVFIQSPDGLTKRNTAAYFMIHKGNRRLKLKNGLLIDANSTAKYGDTYFVYTPDEKVYFPVRVNLLASDVIQRIKKYENEHLEELNKIENDDTLELEEKAQKKKELLSNALTESERNLLDKYGVSFDIIPDQAAYEVLQQQIEEANRIKAQKKQTTLERMMPVAMVVGLTIGFAILAYATANYNSTVSASAVQITSGMQQISATLKSVLVSLGSNAGHTIANSTIPAP